MVEDVGLFLFIYRPCLVLEEEIDLDREAVRGDFLLGDDHVKALVHIGAAPQVMLDIRPIQLYIGHLS